MAYSGQPATGVTASFTLSVTASNVCDPVKTQTLGFNMCQGFDTKERRLKMNMVGRFLEVKATIPYGTRIDHVYATYRRRGRKPK